METERLGRILDQQLVRLESEGFVAVVDQRGYCVAPVSNASGGRNVQAALSDG